MLDFLGYTTAPEDFEAVQEQLPKAIDWLFSTPWWVPSLTMVLLTGLVIWVSWPRQPQNTLALPAEARHEPPPPDDEFRIDPWVARGTPTFVELHLTVDEFRCREVSSSNVFDTAVSFMGDDKTKLEILVVFDRLIVSRDAAITCDNRLDDYRTSIQKITDRYLMCQVLNVGSPAVIRIDCN